MEPPPRKKRKIYSDQFKKYILGLVKGDPWSHTGRRLSVQQAASVPGAPSASLIYAWLHEERYHDVPFGPQKKRGPKQKLSDPEKQVLGGFVLKLNEKLEVANIAKIQSKAKEIFGVELSASFVSKCMKSLGFRSHSAGSYHVDITPAKLAEAEATVQAVRDWAFNHLDGISRVVFEDEMSLWNNIVALRTYSPKGRYVFSQQIRRKISNFRECLVATRNCIPRQEQRNLSYILHLLSMQKCYHR